MFSSNYSGWGYGQPQPSPPVTISTDQRRVCESTRWSLTAPSTFSNGIDPTAQALAGIDFLSNVRKMGALFDPVQIPSGAKVTWATVAFTNALGSGGSSVLVNFDLSFYNVDDATEPADYTTADTTAVTTTQSLTVGDGTNSKAPLAIPGLAPMLQEVVDRGGYSETDSNVALFYDGTGGSAGRLIDYRSQCLQFGWTNAANTVWSSYSDGASTFQGADSGFALFTVSARQNITIRNWSGDDDDPAEYGACVMRYTGMDFSTISSVQNAFLIFNGNSSPTTGIGNFHADARSTHAALTTKAEVQGLTKTTASVDVNDSLLQTESSGQITVVDVAGPVNEALGAVGYDGTALQIVGVPDAALDSPSLTVSVGNHNPQVSTAPELVLIY